ncbi:MAG TPA: M23 family metallopeptidase [Firmicutes bacterium]|nr:M23 family metallopeptidase [Bacillota bacterium]
MKSEPVMIFALFCALYAVCLGGPPTASGGNEDWSGTGMSFTLDNNTMIASMARFPQWDNRPEVTEPKPEEENGETAASEVAPVEAEEESDPSPILIHTVQKGETLWDIAKAYNIDIDTIAAANDLVNLNQLRVGQKLNILKVKGVLHTVAKGDNLWDIAKKYNVDVKVIIAYNRLSDPENLQPNQQLVIPGAKVPKAANRQPALVSAAGKLQKAFYYPVYGRVSSRFGPRWGRMHEGMDLAVNTGTPVKAAAAGRVTFAGSNSGYGLLVKLDHGNSVETRYAHLSRISVKVGQQIEAGQVIGYSGNTGNSTGPHLHFEIRYKGKAVDPSLYLLK